MAFPLLRIAIFVDGCFWHGCPLHGTWPKSNATWWRDKIQGNRRRDTDTNRRLARQGWTVIRAWAHEKVPAVGARVLEAVRDGRQRLS